MLCKCLTLTLLNYMKHLTVFQRFNMTLKNAKSIIFLANATSVSHTHTQTLFAKALSTGSLQL